MRHGNNIDPFGSGSFNKDERKPAIASNQAQAWHGGDRGSYSNSSSPSRAAARRGRQRPGGDLATNSTRCAILEEEGCSLRMGASTSFRGSPTPISVRYALWMPAI